MLGVISGRLEWLAGLAGSADLSLVTRGIWATTCHRRTALGMSSWSNKLFTSTTEIPKANTVVAAESPGIIRKIFVKPGAVVENEEKLIQLNDERFIAEYDVAAAEHEIAILDAKNRVNVKFADRSTEVAAAILDKSVKANQLFSKSIPDTEIQQLQLEFEKSRLCGEQARLEWLIALTQDWVFNDENMQSADWYDFQ